MRRRRIREVAFFMISVPFCRQGAFVTTIYFLIFLRCFSAFCSGLVRVLVCCDDMYLFLVKMVSEASQQAVRGVCLLGALFYPVCTTENRKQNTHETAVIIHEAPKTPSQPIILPSASPAAPSAPSPPGPSCPAVFCYPAAPPPRSVVVRTWPPSSRSGSSASARSPAA